MLDRLLIDMPIRLLIDLPIRLLIDSWVQFLLRDGLVLRYERLHDNPSDEVCHCAVAEDDHVAGRFACHAEELEGCVLFLGIIEEQARTPVDGERAETAKHGAYARDGGNGRLGKHVANS